MEVCVAKLLRERMLEQIRSLAGCEPATTGKHALVTRY